MGTHALRLLNNLPIGKIKGIISKEICSTMRIETAYLPPQHKYNPYRHVGAPSGHGVWTLIIIFVGGTEQQRIYAAVQLTEFVESELFKTPEGFAPGVDFVTSVLRPQRANKGPSQRIARLRIEFLVTAMSGNIGPQITTTLTSWFSTKPSTRTILPLRVFGFKTIHEIEQMQTAECTDVLDKATPLLRLPGSLPARSVELDLPHST